MSGSDQTLPFLEPSFEFLVATLRMQSEMNLGLIAMPGQDKPAPPNLMLARHFIDLMAMLVEKTKGNLTTEESRGLENSITELRFRFVMATENAAKDPGGAGPGGSAGPGTGPEAGPGAGPNAGVDAGGSAESAAAGNE